MKKSTTRAVQDGYQPAPYTQDADETVICPECDRGNDTDATYCDQCGYGNFTPSTAYAQQDDENVQCPACNLFNDLDAEYCDQCGIRMENRQDVAIVPADDSTEPGVSGMNSTELQGTTRNLCRTASNSTSAQFRDAGDSDGDSLGVLFGEFSTFGEWYEIDSLYEGNFIERIAPGAFAETIANDAANMRVLYDHGMDPQLGNKPLGPIRTLQETPTGAYYEVDLLDTDYNRNFIVPSLRGQLINGKTAGSQLGASFRFHALADEWNTKPVRSAYNPNCVPERTITRAQVLEFGPVTFPANPGASAGMRSDSDAFMRRLLTDKKSRALFEQRVGSTVVNKVLAGVPQTARAALAPAKVQDDAKHREQVLRRARAILATAR